MSIPKNILENSFNAKSQCCGCEACVQVCAKNAIKMQEDKEGFLYPKIDDTLCVECGLCEKVCQYINPVNKNTEPQNAFGGHINDAEVLNESTSGGAFSAIADIWCDDNYVILGAEADGLKIRHSFITDKKDLYKFRRSKYSQSVIGNAYKDCKKFLSEGKKVLFSGTPCQIAGLKAFLKEKEFEQLLTIEVICEGVPSPLFVRKLDDKISKEKNGSINSLDYRYKDGNKWDYEVMNISYSSLHNPASGTIKCDRWFNPFWSIWLNHLMSRPSCYKCLYTTSNRMADISLGDLWGVHIYCPDLYNGDRGASLIVTNTDKGKKIAENILKENFIGRELDFSQALKYQGPMRKSIAENPKREDFMQDLKTMDYDSLCKKWAKRPSLKLLISKYVFGTNRQKVWWWNFKKKFKKQ